MGGLVVVTIDSNILMLYHVSLSVENSSSGRRSNGDDFMLNYVDARVVSLAVSLGLPTVGGLDNGFCSTADF